MSIYHCSIKIISRASGRSAVASAAYRSGEKLLNDETGIVHDFTAKGGVVMSEILLPEHAPLKYQDRQTLWNEVQKTEKRSDAQLAREVEVAFPTEMSRDQQIECVRAYIQENFVSNGMIADWSLHDKGDGNPHAHIMLTVRGFDEQERWQQKTKSVFANARDENGKAIYDPKLPSYDPKDREKTSQYRIPVLDENGIQKTRIRKGKGTEYLWEKINIPANDWNDRENAERWRASWAKHCNRYLDLKKQIDHRSYARQGLDKEPTIHEGITARNMEKEGRTSERCQTNREVRERNSIREQIRKLAADITSMIMEKARELYERFTELTGTSGAVAKTGRDDRTDGKTSGRKRRASEKKQENGQGAGGVPKGTVAENKESGRHADIEREIEQRKPAIDRADRALEQLAERIKERKKNRDERIRNLMERRRAAGTVGGDAGSDRQSPEGERRSGQGGERTGQTAAGSGTDELIREIEAAISAATGAEENARAERTDREAQRSRLGLERQREAERREREAAEREREEQERSRPRGRSL